MLLWEKHLILLTSCLHIYQAKNSPDSFAGLDPVNPSSEDDTAEADSSSQESSEEYGPLLRPLDLDGLPDARDADSRMDRADLWPGAPQAAPLSYTGNGDVGADAGSRHGDWPAAAGARGDGRRGPLAVRTYHLASAMGHGWSNTRRECLPHVLEGQDRYICDEFERMVCLDGWTGKLCDIPVCNKGHGCGPYGRCEGPGKCKCGMGYYGSQCEQCIRMPGCRYGTCKKSYECNCMPGWQGTFCHVPVCREGCLGYCQAPGECLCPFGMSGPTCSECQKAPGCLHGTCTKPFQCQCKPGWQGLMCDQPVCRPGCDLRNGHCSYPGECLCSTGYKGENCTECYPYPGCQNGFCSKPWECICHKGWTGPQCNITEPTASQSSGLAAANAWLDEEASYEDDEEYDSMEYSGSREWDGASYSTEYTAIRRPRPAANWTALEAAGVGTGGGQLNNWAAGSSQQQKPAGELGNVTAVLQNNTSPLAVAHVVAESSSRPSAITDAYREEEGLTTDEGMEEEAYNGNSTSTAVM